MSAEARAGQKHRSRRFNPWLWLAGTALTFRSRQGFNFLLAVFRFLAVVIIFLRLYSGLYAGIPGIIPWLIFATFLVYSVCLLVFSRQLTKFLDNRRFHVVLILLDTAGTAYFVSQSGQVNTELYILFLLPLVTAAHFLSRIYAMGMTLSIAGIYLLVLVTMAPENPLRNLFLPWLGRTFFLLGSTWVYRVQRSLPRANETKIISPADARKRLEEHLQDLRRVVPYDSVSVQLLYRDRLQIVACSGFPNPEEIYQIEFPIDDERYPNRLVLQSQRTVIAAAADYPSFQEQRYYAGHIVSWMGIPLISPSTGECFGMISIDSSQPRAYTVQDKKRAVMFARRISTFLIEAALGPAALTQATKQANLNALLKLWAEVLPSKTSIWDDDLQASQDLVLIGQKIFRTEDCSIFFVRHKYDGGVKDTVLHMIASSTIPAMLFNHHETFVNGQHGGGLTALAVHRNRTLNYGAAQIARSPYRTRFTEHLNYLFSKRSRQVLISPIRDSRGGAVGAIKIENRLDGSSDHPFYPVEEHSFEIFAAMVSLILETIRQRNYINRHDESVHGLRGIIHHAAIEPMNKVLNDLIYRPGQAQVGGTLREIQHTLDYVKMVIHGILSDSEDSLYLEKDGLIHALHRYLDSLRDIPHLKNTCDRIQIDTEAARDDLPFQIREVFFNIAREGILNIVRHSGIGEREDGFGSIDFSKKDGVYHLVIWDNGVGFSKEDWARERRRSFGLNDMMRQIEPIKGFSAMATLDIDSQPGSGTAIRVQWSP